MKIFKRIKESFTEEGAPNMKYYAFDWDDNIMKMPTKIIVKDDKGEEVGMDTEDFSHYRSKIGKESFEYKGHRIKDYSKEPFRYFREKGDKTFIIDSMISKKGPSWPDFVEAVNNGSIFAIITARGHSPQVLKEACYNLIISNNGGINGDQMLKNLEKYRDLGGSTDKSSSKKETIDEYLNLCRFYPVSHSISDSTTSPEQLKIKALEDFIKYVKEVASYINKKAFLKNDVKNLFLPIIGFSDDDSKNINEIQNHFKNRKDLKIYNTSTGTKTSLLGKL